MKFSFLLFITLVAIFLMMPPVWASPPLKAVEKEQENSGAFLTAHKALYDINLVATRSGSQIVNISGKMFYEWQPDCDAWITDHRFNLLYEYADSPSMSVTSDFSTFEEFGGAHFDFSARRKRDNVLYQELRGQAVIDGAQSFGSSQALFSMPAGLTFDLNKETVFPMAHTVALAREALQGKKFFNAIVFDGSDTEGPVEINSFIGKSVNALTKIQPSENLDMSLLNNKAWKVRMAVFRESDEESSSDYEMDMIFHENGVISDMVIDYDDFSVAQKLIALERVKPKKCAPSVKAQKNQ